MRKEISVDEGIGKSLVNRKIMNDIMYYLRKILKMARRVQMGAFESYDEYSTEMEDIRENIKRIDKEIR